MHTILSHSSLVQSVSLDLRLAKTTDKSSNDSPFKGLVIAKSVYLLTSVANARRHVLPCC